MGHVDRDCLDCISGVEGTLIVRAWMATQDENSHDMHVLPCVNGEIDQPHVRSPLCPCNPRQEFNERYQNKIYVHERIH